MKHHRLENQRKLKCGLSPTGVLRQNWYLHNSFQSQLYAHKKQKTNGEKAGFPLIQCSRNSLVIGWKLRSTELLNYAPEHRYRSPWQRVLYSFASWLIGCHCRSIRICVTILPLWMPNVIIRSKADLLDRSRKVMIQMSRDILEHNVQRVRTVLVLIH